MNSSVAFLISYRTETMSDLLFHCPLDQVHWFPLALLFSSCFSSNAQKMVEGQGQCDKKVDKNGWFRCKDNGDRCVSDEAICDGTRDCEDASDEVANGWASSNRYKCDPNNLPDYECQTDDWKCHTMQGTGCLSSEFRCDGTQHCQDDTDEQKCPNINFQLSSSTVLGVFIFALLIFTVTLCIAVLGVYATNKARSRRRAAQRNEEQRSRLRRVFSISGSENPSEPGLDNPSFDTERRTSMLSPPPYALVVEAALLEAQRQQGNNVSGDGSPPTLNPPSGSNEALAKPPSYEDIFGDVVRNPDGTDPESECSPYNSAQTCNPPSFDMCRSDTILVHSPVAEAIGSNSIDPDSGRSHALPSSHQPTITVSMATDSFDAESEADTAGESEALNEAIVNHPSDPPPAYEESESRITLRHDRSDDSNDFNV